MISPEAADDTFIEDIQIVSSNTMQPKYTGAIPKNLTQSALITPKVEHLPHNFKFVIDKINDGFRVCVLLRGLPGSGKSFLSYQIVEQSVKTMPEDHIVSADRFFINNRGQYLFQPSKLTEAHDFAQKQFARRASQGLSPLIVDNTNVEAWEMYFYLQVASQYGYHIEIMEPNTPWKSSTALLAKKTQHGVPKDKIDNMKTRFETGPIENLMKSLNLQIVREPKMRNIPPLQPVKEMPEVQRPVIKSPTPPPPPEVKTTSSFQWSLPSDIWDATDSPMPKSSSSSSSQQEIEIASVESQFPQWEEFDSEKKPEEKNEEPQPQKKQRKNKSPQSKLTPHRKDCPNENETFAIIRNLYSTCNDSYLWDFFVRCNGDADWCVNLLCDENLTDQMEPGCDLTCSCFGGDGLKVVEKVKKEQPQQSPTAKSKKAKVEAAKQINVDQWLETKEAIERSITIGQEHFPEHVNIVKNWKNGQKQPITEAERPETPKAPVSPDACEELQQLSIAKELILELDEEYGGGLIKSLIDQENQFPSKIFIRKSVAYQLYLEIMEAFYTQQEESKRKMIKDDEELAKRLNEEEKQPKSSQKSSRKNGYPEPQTTFGSNTVWANESESSDDFALKMSKEKLTQLFPGLNKDDLMTIFAGTNYNFEETVTLIQDSLFCTPEERKQIAASKKKVFNSPWRDNKKIDVVTKKIEENGGYTDEHLKTVEDLRQSIFDHQEEQKACYRKAQEAIQKKQWEHATYLSNIAAFHKQKADEATHEVANLMAGIHQKTQSTSSTLDLHYLNLVEASCLLDTFLDTQIERLRNVRKPFQELFIITGRGAHSLNGVANIKIKTKSRLQERNLVCNENNNPGVLKVKIYQQSLLSNEI